MKKYSISLYQFFIPKKDGRKKKKRYQTSVSKQITILFLFVSTLQSNAQELKFHYINDISVSENGKTLANPFAGGLNAGQYNTIDLNNDGMLDLVVFDRTSSHLNTYINTGSTYDYQPSYEYFFPDNITNWIVFADYDCDGKKDIFTYINTGIRIFRNTSNGDFLTWQEIVNPLLTLGTSTYINLLLNSTDIPGIADIDGDGDLDILIFNFANGARIEFHQNFSVERTGNCGALDFERISKNYGTIQECTCNVFVFNGDDCPTGGRTLHSGGKTTTLYDYDMDGDMDLLIGQEICEDIYLLENKGNSSSPFFDVSTNIYPETTASVSMFTFPTAFVEDVTFDGLKDFIIAPNLNSNPSNGIDFQNSSWLYQNTGTSTSNSFSLTQKNFLQDEMIDLGQSAYPAFVDVDGDGDDDLLIGNHGAQHADGYYATIYLYKNGPAGFVLETEDYATLSALKFTDIKPDFQNIDTDGKPDLVFTGRGNSNLNLHYILNTSTDNTLVYDIAQVNTYDISLGGSDDPVLVDMDDDGDLDLLVSKFNGRFSYYINNGTNTESIFDLQTNTFLGLDFNNSSDFLLTVGEITGDESLDLITINRNGMMSIYDDFINNQDQVPTSELISIEHTATLLTTQLGRSTKPAIGQIKGKKVIALGSIQGGVRMLASGELVVPIEGDLKLNVYPVPSKLDKIIYLQTDNSHVEFELFDISGNQIISLTRLNQFTPLELNLSNLKVGLYIIRYQKEGKTKTVKFVLGDE